MMMDNIKQILNETGRTISNRDRGLVGRTISNRDRGLVGRTISNKDRGLASMLMDSEPKLEDRSPENQIFAIEAEIQNMMKSYETAVRDGDTDRANFIADVIDRMQQMIIERQGNIANKTIARSRPEADFYAGPNMAGGGEAEFTPPTIQELISKSGMVLTNSDREIIGKLTEQGVDAKLIYRYLLENKKKKSVQQLPMMMAEGGEAQMQMSEQEAMAELEAAGPDFEIVEQLIGAVVQMIQQGVSEAEVKEFLREQGLDEEDIQELFEMVMERLQQASIEEPIGKELQGMM